MLLDYFATFKAKLFLDLLPADFLRGGEVKTGTGDMQCMRAGEVWSNGT